MTTCFFPLVGRFGNLLFIYCYARAYCDAHGYTLSLPPWVGEKIFDIPLADRTPASKCNLVAVEAMHQHQKSLIYTRKQVREWLKIKPEVLKMLEPILDNRKQVLLNVRGGKDYLDAGLVCLSDKSYTDAAKKLGYTDWEWETSVHPRMLPQFTGDIDASGLNTTWVALPSFYRLMTAPVLFRANSTFSWWAATLGSGRVYSPVIKGMRGGVPDQYCENFVEGNWPIMAESVNNSDLYLKE